MILILLDEIVHLGERHRVVVPVISAAEFQKILSRPGLILNDPIGALSRLQLAPGP